MRKALAQTARRVGYRQPPVHTRFKPGQSGNPKGRPHGSVSPNSVVQKIMGEKLTVREGDKVLIISKFEAMMRALAMKAMKGDTKAMDAVLSLTSQGGQFAEPAPSNKMTIEFVRAPDRE
jgi:hypothetical protein